MSHDPKVDSAELDQRGDTNDLQTILDLLSDIGIPVAYASAH